MYGSVVHNAHPGHDGMTLPANGQGVLHGAEVQLRGKLYAIAVESVAGNRVVPLTMDVLGSGHQVVGGLVEGVEVDSLKFGERQATGRGGQVIVFLAIGDTDVLPGAQVLTEFAGIAINIVGLAADDGITQTDQAGTKCFAVDAVDLEQTALPRAGRTGQGETGLVNFDIAGLCLAMERHGAGDILAVVILDRTGQHWVIRVRAADIFFDRNGEGGAESDGIRVAHLRHAGEGDTDGAVEFDRAVRTERIHLELALNITDARGGICAQSDARLADRGTESAAGGKKACGITLNYHVDTSLCASVQGHRFTQVFATGIVPCMVNGPCGSTLPASHKHLLFHTPSFRGQACVPHMVLPAFFFAPDSGEKRKKAADNRDMQSLILHNTAGFRHLAAKTSRNLEGQRQCGSHEFSLHWRPVRASRPVATRPVNRPSLAVAPVPLGQRSSVPTRFSALRATCCTARHRTPVTNAELIGAAKAPPVIVHYAVVGSTPRSGVLRFQNIKTKDVPCSTRS